MKRKDLETLISESLFHSFSFWFTDEKREVLSKEGIAFASAQLVDEIITLIKKDK